MRLIKFRAINSDLLDATLQLIPLDTSTAIPISMMALVVGETSYCMVATGEEALYENIILRKGVVL